MPRSLAERVDRASLSRTSVGKGSLGRFSVGTEVSVSSAATRHWEHSVSDIYGQDEIEALLLDLNKLEFAKFDTDFDTFDIDGSRIEGLDEVGDSGPTSPLLPRPTSPGGLSSKSWNSHTHYHQFKDPPDDYGWGGSRGPGSGPAHIIRPLQAAVCYCDISVLKTPRTLLRVLVLVTSVACLSSLVTAGTAKIALTALPHAPKLRFILFVSLASALFSLLVIFLNISHLHALLPMDYAKMQTLVFLLLTVGYLSASSLVVWLLLTYTEDPQHPWLPANTRHHLVTATVLGYLCGLQTAICSYQSARHSQYAKIEESSTNLTLQDTVTTRAVTSDSIMPPRPQPPPPPRPALRSQQERRLGQSLTNENYHPYPAPPPPHPAPHHNTHQQHQQHHQHQHQHQQHHHHHQEQQHHNHNGARTLRPPVRSVSQHRLDYYELRPRQPHVTLDQSDEEEEEEEASATGSLRNNDELATRTTNQTELHPDPNSVHWTVPMRETGAIPKKKKTPVPLPSPLTIHPDEIIALPMEDFSPHLSASTQKPRYNSAH